LKTPYKKKIVITGSTGLLGSYFYKKYKRKYKIIKYPYRIENIKKFNTWISNKKFHYLIHFAGISQGKASILNKINFESSVNILKSLKKNDQIKFFLFISTSHVYGFSNKKLRENLKTKPINNYGLSKKKVEDFIIKNRKNFNFKIGIARIFNITGPKQRKGYFVSDMYYKIARTNFIDNVNCFRDFIHLDDVMSSLDILISKKYEKIINISSGKKVNLIRVCKILNSYYFQKKIKYGSKRRQNLFGDNKLLKSLGKKKFRNIEKIIKSFKK
tara:strand:- start:1759 stop:2574 length:816 start_codon:yes stop_codon:yes gene_type:complete